MLHLFSLRCKNSSGIIIRAFIILAVLKTIQEFPLSHSWDRLSLSSSRTKLNVVQSVDSDNKKKLN